MVNFDFVFQLKFILDFNLKHFLKLDQNNVYVDL